MTYDSSLQSNGALKKTVSSEKIFDCEVSPKVKQEELTVKTSNMTTSIKTAKLALPPYTHRRSQSYNIEFQYNKNTLGLQVNIHSHNNNNNNNSSSSSSKIHTSSQSKEMASKQRSVWTPSVVATAADRESMNELEEPPLFQAFFTYFCYTVLRWFGNLRELLRSTGFERRKGAKDNNSDVSGTIPHEKN